MWAAVFLTIRQRGRGRRLLTALNIAGLSLGFATFLTLMLVVRYEAGYERWIPDAARTFRLDETLRLPGQPDAESAFVTLGARDAMDANFSQIAVSSRYWETPVVIADAGTSATRQGAFVDPEFLETVRLPLAAGDPASVFARPDGVVLTAAFARTTFGDGQAMGCRITMMRHGVARALVVTGVLRPLPANTAFSFDLLTRFPARLLAYDGFLGWTNTNGETYVRLRSARDAPAIMAGMPAIVKAHVSPADLDGLDPVRTMGFSLVALPAIHFHDLHVQMGAGVDGRIVAALGVTGVLALLAPVVNAVNFSAAVVSLRAREGALRRVVGATRGAIVGQFIVEATGLSAVAALIGLGLAEMAVPMVASLSGWQVAFDYRFAGLLAGVLIPVLAVLIGIFPGLAVAGLPIVPVLASGRAMQGRRAGRRLRGFLVGSQFAGGCGLAIMAVVVCAQAAFLRHADRGFDHRGLIVVSSLGESALDARQVAIVASLRAMPGIEQGTLSNFGPDGGTTRRRMVQGGDLPPGGRAVVMREVGAHYFQTLGVRPVAGRLFDGQHRLDDRKGGHFVKDATYNVLINRAGAHALGIGRIETAVGRVYRFSDVEDFPVPIRIAGVVPDLRLQSGYEGVPAQIYVEDSAALENAQATFRFRGGEPTVMAALQARWRTLVPDVPFAAQSVDAMLVPYYRPDAQRGVLFAIGAAVAMTISCLGLYGIGALNAVRRRHEIGVRKTLGATARQVVLLSLGQFMWPLLVASVLVWPLVWLVLRVWLGGFDERIVLSPLYFLIVTLGALSVCLLTMLGQTVHLARVEPTRALRSE